ncbi:NADP-dependent oxidoreductase [Citricoccus sp. GCM10030269]|uniref:NADP-dependent oxidoreductase n=1 Tax=Citricoccus sp. GCM10030269 TaxID=3273388 RepID=UPI00361B3677
MRAFGFTEYGGPEVMRHLEVPDPVPGPGQVLIRLSAAGVNPADIKVRSGHRRGRIEVRFPMAMGREAAGNVVALGEGVTGFCPGDAVFGATAAGTGALAELVLLDAGGTALRPATVPAEQAASIPVSVATAFDALDELDLSEGSTLLVLGAGGGVGTAACGLARLRGLRVLGVASEQKRSIVEDLGAQLVLKGPDWAERARELAPAGVDGVIDTVGGEVLRAGVGLLRTPGQVRSMADASLVRELGGSPVTRRRTTEVFGRVAELVAEGQFTPVVSGSWPLAEAEQAIAAVETGSPVGNVVVAERHP